MIKQEKLRSCEKFQQEGREWDRLVVHRKDTTGDEAVVGHTQLRRDAVEKVTGKALPCLSILEGTPPLFKMLSF